MNQKIIYPFFVFLIISNCVNYLYSMENEQFIIENELYNRNLRYTPNHPSIDPVEKKPIADDIVQPSRWLEYEPKDPKKFGMQVKNVPIDKNSPFSDFYVKKSEIKSLPEFAIRSRHRYTPASITGIGEITMPVIHGTWGRYSDFCIENSNLNDTNDPQQQSYLHIKKLGALIATKYGKPLELLSFGWSGDRSYKGREEGGKFLAEYLDNAYKGTDRIIIGHSHGNNLINCATRHESMKNNPAKLLIYFACPQRPEDQYKPKYFEQLIYFLSHDPIDRIGSIPEDLPQFMTVATSVCAFAICIPKMIELKSPTLSEFLKDMKIISAASVGAGVLNFAAHRVKLNKDALSPQKGKIVVGVDTTHNGKRPQHSPIFYNTVKCLPKILDALQNGHKLDYATSSDFYLDIKDQKDVLDRIIDQKISISIKKPGKTFDVLKFTTFDGKKEDIGAEVLVQRNISDYKEAKQGFLAGTRAQLKKILAIPIKNINPTSPDGVIKKIMNFKIIVPPFLLELNLGLNSDDASKKDFPANKRNKQKKITSSEKLD